MIASNMVDRGFEPQTGQGKTVKLLFASSLLGMQHQGVKTNTGWHEIRIMGDKSTCRMLFQWISTIKNPTKHVGLVQSHLHHLIEMYLVLAMI